MISCFNLTSNKIVAEIFLYTMDLYMDSFHFQNKTDEFRYTFQLETSGSVTFLVYFATFSLAKGVLVICDHLKLLFDIFLFSFMFCFFGLSLIVPVFLVLESGITDVACL